MRSLLETWTISCGMNTLLLDAIKEEHLSDVAVSKGRTVAEQFAHIHNVRLMWIEAAGPELLKGLEKLESEPAATKKMIGDALRASAGTTREVLRRGFETGKIKGFKPHPEAFLGYLIAHESHHRGQLILCLKQHKHLPDRKILLGLWEWGRKNGE